MMGAGFVLGKMRQKDKEHSLVTFIPRKEKWTTDESRIKAERIDTRQEKEVTSASYINIITR